MKCKNLIYLLFIVILLMSCTNKKNHGEWMPMVSSYQSEKLGEKFNAPNPNYIYDGLVFWELSPFIDQAPYAFHWSYETIKIWLPTKSNIKVYNLKVSECDDLLNQLDNLLNSVGESAVNMVDYKNKVLASYAVISPTGYRIKYYPPQLHSSSITLSSIEHDGISWVNNVMNVKDTINTCLKK